MKVALFSDIHGNAVALDTVLEEIHHEEPDKLVCLGDIAVSGPEPVAAVERLQELGCPIIMGNTEEWLFTREYPDGEDKPQEVDDMGEWAGEQLFPEYEQYLESFDDILEIKLTEEMSLLCYHGTPDSPWETLDVHTLEERLDEIIESTEAKVLAGGHHHNQMVRRYKGVTFLNPGSVGLPFGTSRPTRAFYPPWGEWALLTFSDGACSVDLRRTLLDVDEVRRAARESEMPHSDMWIDGWRSRSH